MYVVNDQMIRGYLISGSGVVYLFWAISRRLIATNFNGMILEIRVIVLEKSLVEYKLPVL